jgi:uncharacterized protein YlxW (UPF0749 family)
MAASRAACAFCINKSVRPKHKQMNDPQAQIRKLKAQIDELKASWPAHSVQAWQLQRLEELEEELQALQASLGSTDEAD